METFSSPVPRVSPVAILPLVALASLAPLVGCDKTPSPAVAPPSPVVVTNFVACVREVVVTNVVKVAVTNVVVERREPERILSGRKTAPYAVSSATLDEARLRRFLSDAGARVIACSAGSVALVEASDKAVASLGTVAVAKALSPEDKIAPDAGERVAVTPLSTIDAQAVVKGIRELGGEVVQVVTVGHPRICAKMSYSAIRKLAARGDVRRIERDKK